jgi:endoglucanase
MMVKDKKTAIAMAMSALMAALPAATRAETESFQMRRAINIAQWFTWPRYEATGSAIQWPPYKESPRPPSLAELKALRGAGFDTVRLPVDPAPFIVFEGERRAEVYRTLFEGLARINAAGLKVILDIHPNSRHPVWGQHAVIGGLEAPAFKAVADVIGEMARRLKDHTDSAALELLNEPRLKCKGEEQALWQSMAAQLVGRARAANPELAIIVTGACVSSPDGLLALDPATFADRKVFYTFHYYEPFSFTHQGAQFIPWPDKYLDGVPWPASIRPMAAAAALLEEQVNKTSGLTYPERLLAQARAKHNLERYYASNADASMISGRFGQVADWARRHNIPAANILVGEFGAVRRQPGKAGAFCDDRARWHRDVREAAESHGFAWAYFSYDGPFGLVHDDTDRRLDPVILASLGLKSPCSLAAIVGVPGERPGADAPAACFDHCQGTGRSEAGRTP